MDMSLLTAGLSAPSFAICCAIAALAAFVKGATGFAMPMIMYSGMASFLSPELALAGLILPTFATNVMQAFRDGGAAAWAAMVKHRVFFAIGGVLIVLAGQMVRAVDPGVILLLIGVPITAFGTAQLLGWRLQVSETGRRRAEIVLATVAGITGGLSGIWGPPLVLYLTALETPKAEQLRTQGVAFGLGAVLLVGTHLQTGVLNTTTVPFSAALLAPALAGMWLGQRAHDRLDQAAFRKATLVVLVVAGLNLIRRALM